MHKVRTVTRTMYLDVYALTIKVGRAVCISSTGCINAHTNLHVRQFLKLLPKYATIWPKYYARICSLERGTEPCTHTLRDPLL
jgi:hypothetical protein